MKKFLIIAGVLLILILVSQYLLKLVSPLVEEWFRETVTLENFIKLLTGK